MLHQRLQYAFRDVAVMGRHPVDKNIIQDLSGRIGRDENFTRVGPLGRRVGGAVDVQISQVNVIDARVGSVAGNVDAIQVPPVISRLLISQYCWLNSFRAASALSPLISGCAPVP